MGEDGVLLNSYQETRQKMNLDMGEQKGFALVVVIMIMLLSVFWLLS